jgi:hypothetical protein
MYICGYGPFALITIQSFRIHVWSRDKSNKTDVASEAGTIYPSGSPSSFCRIRIRVKPLNFFLSRYLFYMKQNQIILLTWHIGIFSSFNQHFCCILKVRWLFPNQMFIIQNAFQLLLTDEDTKWGYCIRAESSYI